MTKKLQVVLGVILSISTLVGGLYAFDQRYAKAPAVAALSKRLEVKILQDQYFSVRERIWKLEDRYPNRLTCPPEIKREIFNLKQDLMRLDKELKRLNGVK
jgi:hypothetical protein